MDLLRRIVAPVCCSLALLVARPAAPASRPSGEARLDSGATAESRRVAGSEVLGRSGNLRALIGTPATLARDGLLEPLLDGVSIRAPGVHPLGLTAPDGESLLVVSMRPLDAMRRARLAGYRVGRWPSRGLAARDPRYFLPPGFISVTPGNASTLVSKRFRLSDFLTHDQQDIWPKVLVLRVALLDKLELIGDRLASLGMPGSLRIMSGFRTPQYNALGVGRRGGRASESRHMYGDAADVLVGDLDGDGRITIDDARLLLGVAEGIEAQHPDLVGGLSAYPGNAEHGPFVHIDTRGRRARW